MQNISPERLERLYQDLADLRGENAELGKHINEIAQRVCDIPEGEFTVNVSDASNEQLRERIQSLQQAITELRESIDVQPSEPEVGQQTISRTFTPDGVAAIPDGNFTGGPRPHGGLTAAVSFSGAFPVSKNAS